MYLHFLVHDYILKVYDKGFDYWNGGFLNNGFTVSSPPRTAGTRSKDYSCGKLGNISISSEA